MSMKISLATFATFMALLAGPAAFAQDTAAEQPAGDATQEAPAEGQDAPAAGAAAAEGEADEVIRAVHGDWQIRCSASRNECYMYQLALDALDVPVAEVSMVRLADREDAVAGFTVVTPLRTLLTEGLAVQVDNGQLQRYRFRWCTEAGCFVQFGVSQSGLDSFKRGNRARLTVISVERPQSPVTLDVSLKGFTAAYNDLVAQ